jgi:hypothetical protein
VFPAADTHERTHATDPPDGDQAALDGAGPCGAGTTVVRPVRRLVPGSAQPHCAESEAQVREAEGILCELAAERGLGARATVT